MKLNAQRTLAPLFLSASTMLTGCGSTPVQERQVPVCDKACQKTMLLSDLTNVLSGVRGKNGGIDPTTAAMILRMRAAQDENAKKLIDASLAQRGLAVDDEKQPKCLTREIDDGTVSFVCPKL